MRQQLRTFDGETEPLSLTIWCNHRDTHGLHDQSQRRRSHRRCRRRHAAPVGVARRARHDRHEVRLRHGALRRLHRACRRRRHPFLHHPDRQHRHVRDHDDRGDRRDTRRAPRSRRPGSTARSFNAATASRARSCPLRRCSRATRIRRMPISTTRCPATSAAAGPMSAFAKRSSRPRNRADREADNDPRSPRFPSRRLGSIAISERSLPAQLPAGRSGRGRRPDAEPEPAVRQAAKPKRPTPMASRPTPSSASEAMGRLS